MSDEYCEKILDGRLWDEYCDAIKLAGKQLLRPETPTDALDRAEGLRYLSRLVRAGLEMMVEAGDEAYPRFAIPSHETIKIGADNPDNLYLTARLNPDYDYLLSGHRGSVANLYFSSKTGGYDDVDCRLENSGFLDGRGLLLDDDGRFSVLVSQRKPAGGNWLPMSADTVSVLVRQTFVDRQSEQPAQLKIERLHSDVAPALDPAAFARRLMAAASYTENTVRLFCDWAALFKAEHFNCLPLGDQTMYQRAGGDPNIIYYHGYWQLAGHQAMLIRAHFPDCAFWNFQLDNYWMESLDYTQHRIHINQHNAHYRDDGSVVLVVAHSDPGLPNWISTAGHSQGTHLFRLIGFSGEAPAQIDTEIVNIADLKRGMPL